jgi:hypothetical protein
MQIRYILILMLLGIHQTFSQQIKNRNSRAIRTIFTRPSAQPTTSPALGGKTSYRSSTPLFCPQQFKRRSQRYTTSPSNSKFISETEAQPKGRSRVLEYAKKHPHQIVGIVSGIGTATTGYQWAKKYMAETELNYEIQKLSYAVGFYSPNNPYNKKHVYELLNEFVQRGIVNEKNVSGQTPAMIILNSDYVSDEEKAPMLTLLFNNGATIEENDKKTALNIALGLNKNTQSILSRGLKFDPKLKTLELILPHINTEDVQDLKTVFDHQVTDLYSTLEMVKTSLNELLKEKGRITGFLFDRKKQHQEKIAQESVNNYKKLYKTAKKVQRITEKRLKNLENAPVQAESQEDKDSIFDKIWQVKEQDYPH